MHFVDANPLLVKEIWCLPLETPPLRVQLMVQLCNARLPIHFVRTPCSVQCGEFASITNGS